MLGQFLRDLARWLVAYGAASKRQSRVAHQAPKIADWDAPIVADPFPQELIEARSDDAKSLHELARVALTNDRPDEAIAYLERAVVADPNAALVYVTYGNARRAKGELDAAAELYARAVAVRADCAEAHANLGIVACERGDLEAGAAMLEKAVELSPNLFEAHHNLGETLRALTRHEDAVMSYRRALQIRPRAAESHLGQGMSLRALGKHDLALTAYRDASELRPDLPEPYYEAGNLLYELGRLGEAKTCLESALGLKPEFSEACNGLGAVLLAMGDVEGAVQWLSRAVQIKGDFAEAHNNLGMGLQKLGRLEEAEDAFRRAIDIKPDFAWAHSNLLLALNYSANHTPEEVFREHVEWARRHAAPLTTGIRPHRNLRVPDRKLRIGYVSAYFRNHAVGYFFEPTLMHHDYERFEVFCYSDVRKPDAYTHRMRGYPCAWREIAGQTDEAVARHVASDRIDILVDLTGHTAEHRLLMFARRPAPIQATWNGYPNTTGMEAMDYLITDAYVDPPGMTEHLYAERLVRLPEIYMAYLPSEHSPPVVRPPSVANGYVTFGSFNGLYKVGPPVIDVWAQILRALPTARLMMMDVPEGDARRRLARAFAGHGVEPERAQFVPRLPPQEFLEAHKRADIALDPFPFNGAMTTCQTLWMGVPLITLAGRSHVSRVGVSMLSNLGLERFIARDTQEYVSIAIALANNRAELETLRAGMRERMLASPITDGARLTRSLEAAYVKMWENYCQRSHP